MSDTPDSITLALAQERAMCQLSGQDGRILTVDEALTLRGWQVADDGTLVKIKGTPVAERADVERPPENTAEPKPKRGGRPKLPRDEHGNVIRDDA